VITFEPHPRSVLTGHPVPLLTTLDEKADLLSAAGIDLVAVVPFDQVLSELTAKEFVSEILVGQVGCVHVVVGFNHSIGRGGTGSAETIANLGDNLGFSTEIVEPKTGASGAFSSSMIRKALLDRGDVSSAASNLGRFYTITGTVVRGDGRGKEFGFPTANIEISETAKVVPANGVYAVRVTRNTDGAKHDGIMNIGVRPTVTAGTVRVLEVHLLQFDEELYGESLTVSFVDRIRNERKFEGVDALRAQIQDDISACIMIHKALTL